MRHGGGIPLSPAQVPRSAPARNAPSVWERRSGRSLFYRISPNRNLLYISIEVRTKSILARWGMRSASSQVVIPDHDYGRCIMPKCVRCHDYKAGREARGWWDRRDGVAEYLIYGSHYHITRREGVSYADGAWGWRENAIAVSARLRKATGVWLCAIRGCSLDAKLIDLAERMLEARRGHDCVLDKVAAVWDKIPDDRYLSAGWKTAVGISPYVSGAYPPTIWRCLRAHPSQYRLSPSAARASQGSPTRQYRRVPPGAGASIGAGPSRRRGFDRAAQHLRANAAHSARHRDGDIPSNAACAGSPSASSLAPDARG